MDNAWKDKLRDRFADYSAPEPEGLWEGIEQGLARKERRSPVPVWWVSGGLVAAAAAAALVLFLPEADRLEPDAVRMTDTPVARVETLEDPAGPAEEAAPVRETPFSGEKTAPAFGIVSRRTLLADNAEGAVPAPPSVAGIIPQDVTETVLPDTQPVEDKTVPSSDTPPETATSDPVKTVGQAPAVFLDPVQGKPARKPFTLDVYRQDGQAAANQSRGFGMARTGGLMTRTSYEGAATGGLVRMLSANRASTFNEEHEAPIRVGLLASWPMTDHLSLVSGVNWTTLVSDFEEATASTRNVVRQNLGYLGVPLRVEASWNPWKNLWLHAGAGGMAEKNCRAVSEIDSYIGNRQGSHLSKKLETGEVCWSLGATAGAEYRLTPLIGIYLAPGLEYHFDNGSTLRSAYTARPLSWNLSLGLRFSLGKV